MPFGIHSAQEVFHKRLHELFQDLSGVETDIDDILVWGRTREEHDERLEKTPQRARESNLKLNPDKCKIRRSEVLYIGHVLTTDGVKPDVSKLEAITSMPTPEDKHGIQRLLGMVNYVAKFLPNISEVTSPLRELLKKDVAWHWTERHEQSFNDIKKLLTETSKGVLKYYDPKQPVGLQVDACKSGLGAVLMQGGSPIAYASRSLTETECKYAQIEKELLAVVFGCERFHQYIYAKEVTVETDHRPLVSIITKSLDKAPARLQRMLLRLQRYNIDLQYKPGKELYTADTLSRAHLPTTGDEDEDLVLYVHNMTANLPVSDKKLVELLRETANDKIMVKLIETIQEGWPKHRQNTSKQVREYWPIKDELHVSDGLIFKGESIVVPQALRKDVLAQIHEGHLGIERSKQRARELVFWPGMSKQIEDTVANCSICQELRNSNTKEPMIPHEIPQYPWQIAATDLFTWNGGNYIVVVDYYSRYWEVSSLHNTTSTSVIEKLKQFFARHGIPETLKSDNGPQYSSAEFAKFAAVWKFSHVTSSPKYPQSNGLAEKTVQTVKRTLEKAKRDGKDPYLAMLEQRNTPVGNYKSPAQLSMARRLRSILPCTTSHLLPETTSHQETMVRFQKKQAEQKANYDRSATPLPSLHTGETVRIQRDGDWKPAKVIEVADTPRSYRGWRPLMEPSTVEIESTYTKTSQPLQKSIQARLTRSKGTNNLQESNELQECQSYRTKDITHENVYDRPLTLGDLANVQPEFKCNVTINNWRKTSTERENDYVVLTLSPKDIKRVDYGQEEKEFRSEEFVQPGDIKLSTAMTTSAAVLSHDQLRVVIGLGFGNNIVAQPGLTTDCMSKVVPLIVQVCFGIITIGFPVALYFHGKTIWEQVGTSLFVCFMIILALIAILPTGASTPGLIERFTRWCIINIYHVRLLRQVVGVTNNGSTPPPVMSLSDGGHAEILGLLPLFKLRLPRIVVVNGGALKHGDTYASDLLAALKQAREKLRCSFTGISGRDILEDIREKFVEKPPGNQPRCYRFKVTYYEISGFVGKEVGEGEVLLLMPRHPEDGMSRFKDYKWSDLDGDVKLDLDESAWGSGPALKASDVDRLSGCCFECCHWKPFNFILNPLMGRFPFHSTFNQMFTASQFSAYHREGYRACLEGEAAEFLGIDQNKTVVVLDQPCKLL
ncbi:hypothetical protein QZH41_016810 [Actinostola sp. cb2023]|nr:hypothetical protein QZH41_016810 [Actinostola sp. cb2023]